MQEKNNEMNGAMSLEGFLYCIRHDVAKVLGKNFDVTLHQVTKNNGLKLDGLTIKEISTNIAPTIYLNAFYKKYVNGMELEAIVENIISTYEAHKVEQDFDVKWFLNWETVKEHIIFKLVNYEKNLQMLQEVPYVKYLDLAIIFQVSVDSVDEGIATITIKDEHMSLWEKTTDDLMEVAKVNTPILFKSQIRNIMDILMGLTSEVPDCFEMDEEVFPMFVLSNHQNVNGAATILYPGVLKSFADEKGTDLFVIPSSTHEVILVPADGRMDMDSISEMVVAVNGTEVAPDEVLSDHCYFYCREDDELRF